MKNFNLHPSSSVNYATVMKLTIILRACISKSPNIFDKTHDCCRSDSLRIKIDDQMLGALTSDCSISTSF